ncbi:MAG: aminotransferase class IV [Deltaproteobacteria bacterium]|nr:aminotransferase class IV [Candidatus Zymogenaceae bacterium]
MKAWLNGEIVPWDRITVPLLSHSFSRGSAIFEVVDVVSTVRGPALFGLAEHIERFFNSATLTFMELPLTRRELIDAVISTARENGITNGIAKFFAFYPLVEPTVIPTDPRVDVAIFCMDYDFFGLKPEERSKPARVGISSFRKIHGGTVPVHAKVVGNYVNAFLAKMEVKKKGYDDVIMLDTAGFVAEGATSNVFFVSDNKVKTPTLTSALPGITRHALIELIRDMGYVMSETDIRPEQLHDFDEGFYSGSTVKVQPIVSIDGTDLKKPCPGPVTCAVKERMNQTVRGEIEQYIKWLTMI